MTNGDMIRNMSNEELAHLIDDGMNIFNCRNCSCVLNFGDCREDCYPYIKKWLEESVVKTCVLNNLKTYNMD